MRSGDGACWTGCDATVACPAAILDRLIRRQFKRGQNFREEKPGSEPLIDKHGAFAVPTDASLRGVIPFQHGPGVDVTFLLSAKAAKKLVDPAQLCCDYIVIVVSPSVSRDSPRSSCSCGAVRRVSLKIIQRQSNDRSRTRQNLFRIAPLFLAALHVIHFAVRAIAQPFTKVICVRRCGAGGYATRIKSDLPRKKDKPRLQVCCRNLHHDALAEIGDSGLGFILLSFAKIATATSSSVSTDVSTRISAMFA
jgi:hypothetical protein